MVYAYTGPEVARLRNYKFQVEQERDKYARRAHLGKVLTIGSAALFAGSLAFDWGVLFPHLMSEGSIDFGPNDLRGPLLFGLLVAPGVSFYGGLITGAVWGINGYLAHDKKTTIAQISEELKQVEKGTF